MNTPPTPGPTPAIPPERWPAVSRAFDELVDRSPDEQAAALRELETDDAELAGWLRRLLALHAAGPALTSPAGAWMAGAPPFAAGAEIDVYRLESLLGRGGMASVWRARQGQGVLRDVALKLPDTTLEGPQARAERFVRERDLLAALEHPNIARLYDAGVTPEGQPWLAMELVDGVPLPEFASRQRLDVRARVALFAQVLAAASFAHGRLVIHRDIKASNVLVSASGQVKLLDFGIAHLLSDARSPSPGSASAFTPDAAAPEQLAGQPLGVASDVHALGVLLYELLAGRRPYRLDRAAPASLLEQRRQAAIVPLAVPADLAAIVGMAMALAVNDRYPSADALAQDLERWLQRQPVQARLRQGAGRAYRLGLWLRRQRVAVSAGAAVAAALVLGLGVALWQADRAREEAARAVAVQSLLEGLFDGASPERLRGSDGGARALVLAGADRLVAGLESQPLLQADLRAAAGRLLLKLQAPGPAVERLRAAVAQYDALGRSAERPALETRFKLAVALRTQSDGTAALQALDELHTLALREHGAAHPWALRAAIERGVSLVLLGRANDALPLFQQARAMPVPAGVDGAHQRLLALNAEGDALLDLGRYDEARQRFETVLADAAAVPAFELSDRLATRYNLNVALGMSGRLDAVVERGRPLVAEAVAHLGPQAVTVRNIRNQLAQALAIRGHFAEAVEQQREVLRLAEATPGVAEDDLAHQRSSLAVMMAAAGDAAAALPLAREGLAQRERLHARPSHPRETSRIWLATVLLRAGRYDESAALLAEAAAHLASLPGHPHSRWADALQLQALAERARGQPQRARERLAQACGVYANAQGLNALRCRAHAAWLAAEATPRDAAAAQALATAVAAYLAAQPPHHVAHAEWRLMQAALLRSAGRGADAAVLQRQGEQDWARAMGRPWRGPLIGLR